MKVGEQVRVTGEIKDLLGVLQDLSTWTISAKARSDDATGVEVGVFTMSTPSLGVYVGVMETVGLLPGRIAVDVKFEPPAGSPMFTRTTYVELEEAVTR